MMKKILIIIVAVFALSSCTFDEQPQSTISSDTLFETEAGIELYVYSFYDMLPSGTGIFSADDMSDIVAANTVTDYFREGDAYSAETSTGWDWESLRNINYFIEKVSESSVDDKDAYLGIARFFRAYFYFEKVKRFGDVPWIDQTIDVDDTDLLYATRDSRDYVMEKVLEDIDFAIENIELTSDATCTQITKNVARAYKTRMCLYEGSIRKYHTSYGLTSTADTWFQYVVDAAEDIDGFSLYDGVTPYRDLFISTSAITSEMMLVVDYDTDLSVTHSSNRSFISPTFGYRPSLSRHFVNTYLKLDGTSFTDIADYEKIEFQEEVKDRDLRLGQTIRLGDYHRTEYGVSVVAPPAFATTFTGYQPIKWCYDERFPYDDESMNDNTLILMRYAEVLLNVAEAKAELGTITSSDWANTIGAIRQRAGITGGISTLPTVADPYLVDFYNNSITDPVILEVRRERAIELMWEGRRYDDLIRWRVAEILDRYMIGIYVPALNVTMDLNEDGIDDVRFYQGDAPEAISGVTDVNVSSDQLQVLEYGTYGQIIYNAGEREWSDKKYLYPIPQSDILMNENLEQNPGW